MEVRCETTENVETENVETGNIGIHVSQLSQIPRVLCCIKMVRDDVRCHDP